MKIIAKIIGLILAIILFATVVYEQDHRQQQNQEIHELNNME